MGLRRPLFSVRSSRARLTLRPLSLAVPLVLVIVFLVAGSRAQRTVAPEGPPRVAARARPPASDVRLVVILVDSLRPATLDQAGLMPNLLALAGQPGAIRLHVRTCASNFSLPCIQTIFSGRESPMAGGIEQFAGYGASRRDLVETAAAAGLKVALVGNDMLSTLYGRHARARFSVAPLGLDALPSDMAAIAQARRYLCDPANDIVLLHTNGTDHVTHYDLPGTAGYAAHFHAVDAALLPLLHQLDMSRDSVVVLGDHGHDNEGHHARDSVAIFAGRHFTELFQQIDVPGRSIEQKDLLYLLSYPHQLPLTAGYEGRFFAIRAGRAPGEHLAAFLDVQRQGFLAEWQRSLAAAEPGRDGETIQDARLAGERAVAARMRPDWRPGNARAWRTLLDALPLLSCLFLWIAWTYGASAESRLSAWPALGGGSLAVLIWFVQRASILSPLVLALVPLGGAAWLAERRRSWRPLLMLGLLLAGATVTAAVEPAWRSFFHSRDEFHWGIPVFYVLVLCAGAVVVLVRRGSIPWPSATQLAAFVALPAGVYYYQFDENPLRAYLIPAVLVLSWRAAGAVFAGAGVRSAARRLVDWVQRRWRASLLLAVTGLLLIPQDAGGWQWHSWLAGKLRNFSPGVSAAAYALVAACLVSLLVSWRRRVPMVALLFVLPLSVASSAGLEIQRFAAAFIVVLFAGAWLATLSAAGGARGWPARATAGHAAEVPCYERACDGCLGRFDEEMTGLMLAAASMAIVLTTFDGLVIDHVDFTFALQYTTAVRTDAVRFLVVAPLVAIKYASPVLAMLAFHRLLRGPESADRAIGFMLLFLTLKLLALLLQVLVGALDTGEKFFELAQTEFIFVGCLVIVVAMWTVGLWAAEGAACALGFSGSAGPQEAVNGGEAVDAGWTRD